MLPLRAVKGCRIFLRGYFQGGGGPKVLVLREATWRVLVAAATDATDAAATTACYRYTHVQTTQSAARRIERRADRLRLVLASRRLQ